jgi:hypothetical protein
MPEIGTSGSISGMRNGALPTGPSDRAHPRVYSLPPSNVCLTASIGFGSKAGLGAGNDADGRLRHGRPIPTVESSSLW